MGLEFTNVVLLGKATLGSGGGGGSSLPDQTGHSGEFLTTDGTDASWGYALSVPSSDFYIDSRAPSVMIGGYTSTLFGSADGFYNDRPKNGFSISRSNVNGYGISVHILNFVGNGVLNYKLEAEKGFYCSSSNNVNGKNLGTNEYKWGNVYTQKLNNGADITVPTTGGTMAVINTPVTAPELAVGDWSSNTQTITVTGVTASNVVLVSPAPASAADYAAAGIICTAQATDSLTFTCTTVPTNAITLSVVIL